MENNRLVNFCGISFFFFSYEDKLSSVRLTNAVTVVGAQTKTRITDALERTLHVHAFTVLAHPRHTLVRIHAEGVVSRCCKTRLTNAVIRSRRVLASTV